MCLVKRALVGLVALNLALAACGSQPSRPPTAAEILDKPQQASVKDAHFTLTAHVVSGNVTFDATGDGLIVIKPAQASRFTMQTTVQGQSLKFSEIIAGGKEYDLSPDNPRWVERPANTTNPASIKGQKAQQHREETLSTGKAWHVKATDESGNPFEAWIRESDGYPLKYVGNSQGTLFTAIFDKFNTGQTVSAPPPSDIQP